MEYDNTNRGVLFIHDKKGNPKAPDRTGNINVGGVDYRLSGWVKTSSKGVQFLSLTIQPKEQKEPAKEHVSIVAETDLNDDIPF